MPSRFQIAVFALMTPALLIPSPISAQLGQSESYKFLQAIRDGKGAEVIAILDKPGSQIVNTRDPGSGEAALHIVAKRGDELYVRFLLQKGADVNLRDRAGNTALLLAVTGGHAGLIPILVDGKANPNVANNSGETPLIRAVQRRDTAMVRALLTAKADPDQADVIAGLSARDYATQDTRNAVIARIFADVPKKTKRAVSGPKL